jgi:hypothetical protein
MTWEDTMEDEFLDDYGFTYDPYGVDFYREIYLPGQEELDEPGYVAYDEDDEEDNPFEWL